MGVVDDPMQDASVPGSDSVGTLPHEELSGNDTVPGLPQEVFAAGVVVEGGEESAVRVQTLDLRSNTI